jgi:hypothetical protein
MKKILLILITTYSLFADALPTTATTTVKSLSNGNIQLSSNVPAGRSGIIIHNYGNGLSAITHTTISLGNGKASLQPNIAIDHKNIPSIKTDVIAGDKVIFGNFYNNALVIAPNQVAYKQITQKFSRTWIHPDAFALDFMKEGETSLTMHSLNHFAKKNQIGLVLVVASDKLLIIDPISKKIIGSTGLKTNPNSAMSPFYARFNQMNVSLFNLSDTQYTPYFQSMAGLQ